MAELQHTGFVKVLAMVLLCLFCHHLRASFPQQSQIDRHKSRIEKIEKEIELLDSRISATQKQHKNTLSSLVLIQRKIKNREAMLAELDKKLREQNDSITLKNAAIEKAEKDLENLEKHYSHLLLNTYKHRDSKVWFLYIFASSDLSQGIRRWQYLKNYADAINKQGVKIREQKAVITQEKSALMKMKPATMASQKRREGEYNRLLAEKRSSEEVAATLVKNQTKYRRELTRKRQEVERLNKEVAQLVANAIKQRTKEESGNSQQSVLLAASNVKLSADFEGNKGKLPWPVANGVITEQFGQHNHPLFKGVKLPFNNGVNISAPAGSSVSVVFNGRVSRVLYIPGYNQCVLVEHGNYFTFYCKLESVSVKVGDSVKTGDMIGKLSVSEETSILHFELWNKTVKQNPELWLR